MAEGTEALRVFPFRYKLTLLIAGIVMLVLAAILAVAERHIEREFRALVIEQLSQTDEYVAETIAERYERLRGTTRLLSDDKLVLDILTDPNLSDVTRNDIVEEEILPALVGVDLLAVLDDGGRVLGHNAGWASAVTGIFDRVKATPWFPELLAGQPGSGTVLLDRRYHQVVGMPVFIGEEMVGAVFASQAFTEGELASIKDLTGADIAILKDDAVFLSTFGTHTDDPERLAGFHAAVDAWLVGTADPERGAPGEARLVDERFLLRAVRETAGLAPPYVVAQSLDRRLAFLGDLRVSTVLIGVLGVGVGVALGFVMALAVSRPIRSLRRATREVAQENLSHRVSIQTHDEFAELGVAFNRMIEGLAEKKRIRAALDKSVSREVAEHILGSDARLGGELRRATILFSDMRDFTPLAERLPPETLIGLINAYYTWFNRCIDAHHGITDKYIGDAVMALFGIPVAREQHALDAVRTAQDMMGAMRAFNREVASQHGVEIEIGIGISTGEVVAGLVGSEDRLAYT
ncbi:MAG: adenylate/guanylate cyclase domain-containing protein, partial [Myxococcota bacterium]